MVGVRHLLASVNCSAASKPISQKSERDREVVIDESFSMELRDLTLYRSILVPVAGRSWRMTLPRQADCNGASHGIKHNCDDFAPLSSLTCQSQS